jgi:hypothetical protein
MEIMVQVIQNLVKHNLVNHKKVVHSMVRVPIMFIMVVVKIKEECCSLIYLNDEREKKKRYELPK